MNKSSNVIYFLNNKYTRPQKRGKAEKTTDGGSKLSDISALIVSRLH